VGAGRCHRIAPRYQRAGHASRDAMDPAKAVILFLIDGSGISMAG